MADGRSSAKALRAASRRFSISSSIKPSRCLARISLNGSCSNCTRCSWSSARTPSLADALRMIWKSGKSSAPMKLNCSKNSCPGCKSRNNSTIRAATFRPISTNSSYSPTLFRTASTCSFLPRASISKVSSTGVPNRMFSATDALSL